MKLDVTDACKKRVQDLEQQRATLNAAVQTMQSVITANEPAVDAPRVQVVVDTITTMTAASAASAKICVIPCHRHGNRARIVNAQGEGCVCVYVCVCVCVCEPIRLDLALCFHRFCCGCDCNQGHHKSAVISL